ncbi:MAG: 4-hydroxythreonine-4-phosphate dehydrogenase PdxA [Myxococcaceae bacterium]|nr:4-hydroxythreonine-4-phosphate dehydrogenase PdxA [Myxococcaceae bacterium]
MGISLGCPCGIGPEIVEAALADPRVRDALEPSVFGSTRGFRPGKPDAKAGKAQHRFILDAVEAAKRREIDAICTAPVSKEVIIRSGIAFTGHTELLAASFGAEVLMLLAGPRLKVALATNHLPLSKVPGALKVPKLTSQLELLCRSLGKKAKVAVCGLNPHAGEGGKMGREELEIIGPAIERAREKGLDVTGPIAADGLFAKLSSKAPFPFDGVLAMFHDQGLCVAKALDFQRTVNVTLGLPLPRTSPDHGTAYDIAGKGKADPEPMVQALLMAVKLVTTQRHVKGRQQPPHEEYTP